MSFTQKEEGRRNNANGDAELIMRIIQRRLSDPNLCNIAKQTLQSYVEDTKLPVILEAKNKNGDTVPVPVELIVKMLHKPRGYDAHGNPIPKTDIKTFEDFTEDKLEFDVIARLDNIAISLPYEEKEAMLDKLENVLLSVKDRMNQAIGSSLREVSHGWHENPDMLKVPSEFPPQGTYMQSESRSSFSAGITFSFNPKDIQGVAKYIGTVTTGPATAGQFPAPK